MTKRQRRLISLALTVLFSSTSVLSSINCYNPDGSQANDDVPCTSDATTFCCNKGDICMSNGLCYLQGKRGFVLSRASCTDRSWEACGSFTYCMPYNRDSGFPIVTAQYNGTKTVHCCGTANWKNGTVNCGNFKSVTFPSGTAIPGVAGLSLKPSEGSKPSNISTPIMSTTNCNTSRETAIGTGVGVPLGMVALASVMWALWERRARFKALSTVGPVPMAKLPISKAFHRPGTPRHPVELGALNIPELGGGDLNSTSSDRRVSCVV